MKPSELRAGTRTPVEAETKKQPDRSMSPHAEPPISEDEAKTAPIAVCLWHDGIVRLTGDREGAVYFCPIGRQYWRYTRKRVQFWRGLSYRPRGYV